MSTEAFTHDVFLSHSAKDKAVVRPLAERLGGSRYAAAVVRKVRKHPQELGCIREDELLAGDLDCQDFKLLP